MPKINDVIELISSMQSHHKTMEWILNQTKNEKCAKNILSMAKKANYEYEKFMEDLLDFIFSVEYEQLESGLKNKVKELYKFLLDVKK